MLHDIDPLLKYQMAMVEEEKSMNVPLLKYQMPRVEGEKSMNVPLLKYQWARVEEANYIDGKVMTVTFN